MIKENRPFLGTDDICSLKESSVEIVLRMRTVARALIFIGSALLWLILLTILNATVLRTDDTLVVMGALAVAVLQTIVLALVLKF